MNPSIIAFSIGLLTAYFYENLEEKKRKKKLKSKTISEKETIKITSPAIITIKKTNG